MSYSDSKLFQYAKREAEQAVTLDSQGQYQQAMNKYIRAAEILVQLAKYTKNPNLRDIYETTIKEYMDRARHIQGRISGPRSKTKTSSPTEGKSEGEDSSSTPEGINKEEQELIDSVSGTILTESPNVKWSEIAGLDNCKQSLREAIVLPIAKPELFKGARKPWSGILLFGPPGCGKTLLAKAAATECKATFFSISSAEILSKWLGESEKLISTLFKLGRMKAPSLIFIDEIDSVATRRGEGTESGGERRVKTQLLSEIQGVKSTHDKPLLILGATNRPWDLDAAMLSRFEKKVYVPLPDIPARAAIFKIHTSGVNTSLRDEDYIELAVRSENYSGRDISNVCREVIMLPVRELDMSGLLENSSQDVKVRDITLEDFKKTFKKVKPMITKKELAQHEEWRNEFGE